MLRHIAGFSLLALLFIGIFIFMVIDGGWKLALQTWGTTIVICGTIVLVAWLLFGG